MTKVEISPGACGFLVTILATKVDPKKASVAIQTECEQVNEMASMITHLTVQDILGFPFGEGVVYEAAKKCRFQVLVDSQKNRELSVTLTRHKADPDDINGSSISTKFL